MNRPTSTVCQMASKPRAAPVRATFISSKLLSNKRLGRCTARGRADGSALRLCQDGSRAPEHVAGIQSPVRLLVTNRYPNVRVPDQIPHREKPARSIPLMLAMLLGCVWIYAGPKP